MSRDARAEGEDGVGKAFAGRPSHRRTERQAQGPTASCGRTTLGGSLGWLPEPQSLVTESGSEHEVLGTWGCSAERPTARPPEAAEGKRGRKGGLGPNEPERQQRKQEANEQGDVRGQRAREGKWKQPRSPARPRGRVSPG